MHGAQLQDGGTPSGDDVLAELLADVPPLDLAPAVEADADADDARWQLDGLRLALLERLEDAVRATEAWEAELAGAAPGGCGQLVRVSVSRGLDRCWQTLAALESPAFERARVPLQDAVRPALARAAVRSPHLDVRLSAGPDARLGGIEAFNVTVFLAGALANAGRHAAGATHVAVAVRRGARGIEVRVEDDGGGLPGPVAPAGLGIRTCRELARASRGSVEAAGDRGGFVTTLRLPFVPGDPAPAAAPSLCTLRELHRLLARLQGAHGMSAPLLEAAALDGGHQALRVARRVRRAVIVADALEHRAERAGAALL